MARKKLGAILESKGVITEFQLVAALSHQRKWKIRLGKALLELGYIEERKLFEILADQWGMELVDLYEVTILDDIKRRLSREKGTTLMAFPIRIEDDDMVVAISEPDRENIKVELERLFGMPVKLVLAMDSQIEEFTRTLPEKVSVASVKPVKKAFRKNQNGDIEPVEDNDVILGAGKDFSAKEAKKEEPIEIPEVMMPAGPAPEQAPGEKAESDEPFEMVETVETDEIIETPVAVPPEPEKEPAGAEKMEGLAVDVPDLNPPEPAPEQTPAPEPEKTEVPETAVEPEQAEEPEVPAETPEPAKPETGDDTDEFWEDANVATVPEVPPVEKEAGAAQEPGPEPEVKATGDFFPGQMRDFDPEALEKEPAPAAKGEDEFFPGQMKTFEPEALQKEAEVPSEDEPAPQPEPELKPVKGEDDFFPGQEKTFEPEALQKEAEVPSEDEPAPQPEPEPELKAEEEVKEIGVSDAGEPVELKEEAPPETEKPEEKKEEFSLPPLDEVIPEKAEPKQEPRPETLAGLVSEAMISGSAPAPEPVSAEEMKVPEKTPDDAEKQLHIKKIEEIEQQMQNLAAMVAALREKIHS